MESRKNERRTIDDREPTAKISPVLGSPNRGLVSSCSTHLFEEVVEVYNSLLPRIVL